jgi:hypothetical protein
LLLEFLGDWILDEPAVEFEFGVLDLGAILVLEGELVTVVLAEDFVTLVDLLLGDLQAYNLIIFAQVAQLKS